MIFLNILLFIVGYLMIGGFINGLVKDITLGPEPGVIILWPLVVIAVFAVIPYKLGSWIKDRFD